MDEILGVVAPLLLAHILSVFFIQGKWFWSISKHNIWKSLRLLLHSFLAGLLAYAFTSIWEAHPVFWMIFLAHWTIGIWISSRKDPDKPQVFWVSQSLHGIVILGLTIYLTDLRIWLFLWHDIPKAPAFTLLSGFLFILNPCSVIIQKIMSRWHLDSVEVLPKAGHYIGMMERILILIFIMLQQYAAIGFLITAKSILRLGGSKMPVERKETEYILIGTLLSFTCAVITGIAVSFLIFTQF